MTKRSHKSTDIVPKNTDSPVIVEGILLEDIRGLIESEKSVVTYLTVDNK